MKTINIPLPNQVTSLEVSRELTDKLASVGMDVESFRYWGNFRHKHYVTKEWLVPESWSGWQLVESKFAWGNGKGGCEVFPAYTLPELLAMLPAHVPSKYKGSDGCEYGFKSKCAWFGRCNGGGHRMEKDDDNYTIGYMCRENCFVNYESLDNPATAAAKLLIWCIDNGYIGE